MYNIFLPNINLIQKLPLNVVAVGEHEDQKKVVRENGYPGYHLMYSQNGSGYLEINNKKYHVPENSFFILKPNQPHIYYPEKEPWNTRWVIFEGDGAEDYLRNLCLLDLPPIFFSNGHRYNNIFDSMHKNSMLNELECIFKTSSLLCSILIDFSHTIYYDNDKGNSTKTLSPKIKQVLEFIHKNYSRDISLDDMAESIEVSKQYLCRLFKNMLAVSPYEYLIEYRLKAAKELLSNSNHSVKDVSVLAGFNTISYFCHVFKKHENMTPNEFRDLCLMV